MTDLRYIDIPKITDGSVFEHLCRDLWRNNTEYEFVELNGRSGQDQHGVDVFGRIIESGEWCGIQCKVKSTGQSLTKKDIETEIAKALTFNPSLAEFKLCTTLSRDEKLQTIVRNLQTELHNSDAFKFELFFWEDIKELLQDEKNISIYHRFYQKYFADSKRLGHSIGKLFNLELGFENEIDTLYEIMLGKIPMYKESKPVNVNYYRGTYFFINFSEHTTEVFTLPCFESDIMSVFTNPIDRYRIVRWLEKLENVDDFIYSDEYNLKFYITNEERRLHQESLREE